MSKASTGDAPRSCESLFHGLSRFSSAAAEAALGRTYDIEVGVCLGENPTRIDNNRPLAAPLPCADAVFNVSGVEGTSYVLTDLTPGRFYSFRVVTRDDSGGGKGGDEGAAAGGKVGKDDSAAAAAVDKGSVSALAVSVASGAVAEGGDVSYSTSSGAGDGASIGEDFAAMGFEFGFGRFNRLGIAPTNHNVCALARELFCHSKPKTTA